MKAHQLILIVGCFATAMACKQEEPVVVETPVVVKENPKECLCDELYLNREINAFFYQATDLPFSGTCKLLHEDGSLKETRDYSYGRGQGFVKEWHPNGQLKSEKSFVENRQDGLFNEWDEQGKLIYSASYEKGKIVDILVIKGEPVK